VTRTQERARATEREAATGAIGRPRAARDHFEVVLGTRVSVTYMAAVQANGGVQVPSTVVRVLQKDLRVRRSCMNKPLAHLLVLKAATHATDTRPHGLGVQSLAGGQHIRQQLGDARKGNETRQLRLRSRWLALGRD